MFCANDPVGVAGGVGHLQSNTASLWTWSRVRATDNNVGVRFVEREVGKPAINARTHAKAFGEHLLDVIARRGVGNSIKNTSSLSPLVGEGRGEG